MKILDLVQGSDAWLKARLEHCTASEAAAMMGDSKYMTRDELLYMKKTGIAPEVSPHLQRIFDDGHKKEAMARPIVEGLIGEELYPVTGVSEEYMHLLASFDGITMMEDADWEHKMFNEALAQAVRDGSVVDDPNYYWQMEQQLLVSGAEKVKFTVSDGTEDNMEHIDYTPVPGRAEELLAGWEQFRIDLEAYELPQNSETVVVGAVVSGLPAIVYSVDGTEIESNIIVFDKAVKDMVALSVSCKYETDQDFADAEARIKAFKENEKKARLVADMIVAEVVDINEAKITILTLVESMRKQRLIDEKEVAAQKLIIRGRVKSSATKEWNDFLATLTEKTNSIGLGVSPDFDGVMRGKKTVKSLVSACNDEIARCKILANTEADKIENNLALIAQQVDYLFLFNDKAELVTKDSEHLGLLIQNRITEHDDTIAQKKIDDAAAEKLDAEDVVSPETQEEPVSEQTPAEETKEAGKATEHHGFAGFDHSEAVRSHIAGEEPTYAVKGENAIGIDLSKDGYDDDEMPNVPLFREEIRKLSSDLHKLNKGELRQSFIDLANKV